MTYNTMTKTTTETLADVKARQVIWLPWMIEATKGLADSDRVITTTQMTLGGSYLFSIVKA